MNKYPYLFRGLPGVVLLFLFGAGCQTLFDREMPGSATIVRIKGEARCSDPKHKAWQKLKPGDVLETGSVLQTEMGREAYVDFDLEPYRWRALPVQRGMGAVPNRDKQAERARQGGPVCAEKQAGNIVRLEENTILRIEQLAGIGKHRTVIEPRLRLVVGHLLMIGDYKALGPEAAITVSFTNGLVRMHSGYLELYASGELNVARGTVTVTLNDKHMTKEVPAGHKFDPVNGEVTALPADVCRY